MTGYLKYVKLIIHLIRELHIDDFAQKYTTNLKLLMKIWF